jgi:hypothetical protein
MPDDAHEPPISILLAGDPLGWCLMAAVVILLWGMIWLWERLGGD